MTPLARVRRICRAQTLSESPRPVSINLGSESLNARRPLRHLQKLTRLSLTYPLAYPGMEYLRELDRRVARKGTRVVPVPAVVTRAMLNRRADRSLHESAAAGSQM